MSTKPGWYNDPTGDTTLLRWFDGANWTEQTKERPPAPTLGDDHDIVIIDDIAPALADAPTYIPAATLNTPPHEPEIITPSTEPETPVEWSGWDTQAASIDDAIIEDTSAAGFDKTSGFSQKLLSKPVLILATIVIIIAITVVAVLAFSTSSPSPEDIANASPSHHLELREGTL